MPAVLSMIFTANRNRIPCCFKIATHFPKVSHQAIFSAPTAVLLQSFALSLTQSPIFARKPLCRCYNGARFNLSMLPRRLIRNTERFSSSLCVPRFLLTNNTLSSLSLSLHQMKRWDCCTVTRHWLLCEQYRMYGTSVNKLTCELRIATFNVLAPCYKRLPSSQKRESDFPSLYRPRQASIISMLGEQRDLDIIALQEFWFHEDIQSMYMNALGPGYHAHFMQRPKGRDDGVAIFVRNHIQVINTQRLRFDDSGMRVALLLHLRLRSTEARSLLSIDQTNKPITKDPAIVPHLPCPATDGFVDFILANTHFSFPHSDEEHQARLQQSRVLSAHVDDFAREQNVGTTVLTGDFNGNVNSRSCSHLLSQGYESLFHAVHQRELTVTHRTHRGEDVGVDFVFMRSKDKLLKTKSAYALPQLYPDQEWPEDFDLSDHRPVVVSLLACLQPVGTNIVGSMDH